MRKYILFFLPFLLTFALFPACQKDPEIITKTIIETDTLIVNHHDTLLVTITDTVTLTNFILDTATTFILTRHAETTGIGSDPGLSAAGMLRADELVRVLKNVPVTGVYSTNYNRTKQTAQAVATDKGLTVTTYNNLDPLANGILQNHHGGVVLVVGHSNTTPDLLNLLTGTNDYSLIPDTEYDNLYVVTVFEKGRATVVHFKYGE